MPNTTNFNWATPADTDLVKDGAAAIRTLGNSIDSSFVDLKGGTTGQVLTKASNTDLDFTFSSVDPLVILDAKGDLISATAADTPARLAVGANGTVLTADSAETTGLKWAAPAAGGKVLQVVSAITTTATTIASTTLTDTTITASITPSAATSKVLILISASAITSRASDFALGSFSVLRGATEIMDNKNNDDAFGVQAYQSGATQSNWYGQLGITYLDSPNTTSSTTYKLQASAERTANSGQVIFQSNGNMSTITLLEIGA